MTGGTGRDRLLRGLLGGAAAILLVAGVAVGCSSDTSDTSATDPGTSSDSAPATTGADIPQATGATDPATVEPPVWSALAGNDVLANFRDTPYNNDGAPAPTVVPSPNVPGRQAIRFTMPGGGKRTELEPNAGAQIREGDEFWYGFAHYLPPDFPVNTQGWQVIAQWKNSGEGSPPIEVKVGNGQYQLDGGAGGDDPGQDYFTQPIGPARPGQQTNLVVHVKFSSDPSKALVDVWLNGQKRIASFRPPGGTRYASDDSYLKTGIYRDTEIDEDTTLYLNDARIARSYASAAALVGPGSPP